MSAIKDAIAAIRDAMNLADEVRRVGETLKDVARELRDHGERLTRLEAKWDTAMQFATLRSGRTPAIRDVPRLPRKK